MTTIIPFICMSDRLREAVDFYCSLFEDALLVNSAAYPPGTLGPEGEPMSATLRIGSQQLVIINGGPNSRLSPAFSLRVTCPDQAEIDRFWAALSEGAEQMQCGWVTDSFGLTWQIVPEGLTELLSGPDQHGARRAWQAMLGMVKLNVSALPSAYDGPGGTD